ncbi:DUF1836 domain-containing protein [Paenibacillus sp. HB172176]|uniref:DUF1836 domain-containing protein n=1 Tax=Paenibacillus sp. HB172176 TaxID=2493690 RepID=UPI0014391D65|nr:DUF1836 domain-containing protein [Paenibacillus sp. HB172176]
MNSFTLTRLEMARILRSMAGEHELKPIEILQQAWRRTERPLETAPLPAIVEKLMRCGERKGLSLQEIAELGGLIEFSALTATSMQNWVKRDFKSYFDSPKAGKKYSLNQAALLFIIDDLKSNLDFESIRGFFAHLLPSTDGDGRKSSAWIEPIAFLECYAAIFQRLDGHVIGRCSLEGDRHIRMQAKAAAETLDGLNGIQRAAAGNLLAVAVISIQSSYFQTLARQYCNATLFLQI